MKTWKKYVHTRLIIFEYLVSCLGRPKVSIRHLTVMLHSDLIQKKDSVFLILDQLGGSYKGLWFVRFPLLGNDNISLSAISVFRGAFGQGTGPTFLNDVVCNGTESSLLSCSHRNVGPTYCSHFEDVEVVCPTGKSCIGLGWGKVPLTF